MKLINNKDNTQIDTGNVTASVSLGSEIASACPVSAIENVFWSQSVNVFYLFSLIFLISPSFQS